jgi:serine/threonine protein kinase
MHRDFKLSNVLSNNGLCKIADLGYAKKMKNN